MLKILSIISLSLFVLFIVYVISMNADSERLQFRNNLYYRVNSDSPFCGRVAGYYTNGQKKIEAYLWNGKPVFKLRRWYENGQLKDKIAFKVNNVIEIETFHFNGNPYMKGEFNLRYSEESKRKVYQVNYLDTWYSEGNKEIEIRIGAGHSFHIISWYNNKQKNAELKTSFLEIWRSNGMKKYEGSIYSYAKMKPILWDYEGNKVERLDEMENHFDNNLVYCVSVAYISVDLFKIHQIRNEIFFVSDLICHKISLNHAASRLYFQYLTTWPEKNNKPN